MGRPEAKEPDLAKLEELWLAGASRTEMCQGAGVKSREVYALVRSLGLPKRKLKVPKPKSRSRAAKAHKIGVLDPGEHGCRAVVWYEPGKPARFCGKRTVKRGQMNYQRSWCEEHADRFLQKAGGLRNADHNL